MEPWEKIIKLSSVDSTNNYTADFLRRNQLTEGSIICTLYQNKGKGLEKNSWESEKGRNILLSLILYPQFLPISNQFMLSKAVSLGIVNYALSKIPNVKIKWPNDIYYQNKKLAGILIENTIRESRISQSIIGIGLNLNQTVFFSDAPNPCSLSNVSGKSYSLDQEIIKLRNNIRFFYDKLRAEKFKEINSEYLKCLYRFNEFHPYKSNNNIFKGKIIGVNEFGHLQVTTENNDKKEFDLKEIEFIV